MEFSFGGCILRECTRRGLSRDVMGSMVGSRIVQKL